MGNNTLGDTQEENKGMVLLYAVKGVRRFLAEEKGC
jgi:hypothetical protein